MKWETTITTEIEVTTLRCDIGVRYWEDGEVNGEADNNDAPTMPFAEGGRWKIDIGLDTGVIANWPQGTTAKVHYKVCDDGIYSLLTAEGRVVGNREWYVPAMLCPAGDGYGDYVIMEIGPDGAIADWEADLEYFEQDND